MVTMDKVKRGLANYADSEIVSKIPSGFKRVAVGTAISLYLKNLDKIADNALVKGLGIFAEDGSVDIDTLADTVKANIPDSGMRTSFDLMGMHIADMTLHKSDIDNMRYMIVES